MIYLTGANGLVGKRLSTLLEDFKVRSVSYRDTVFDIFDSHEESFLVHLAWSSNTRIKDKSVETDIVNSEKLFDFYKHKNPNGKIIFLSTAGDLHRDSCNNIPTPHSLYGKCKLDVENILKKLDCQSVTFRVTNIWGGIVDKDRVNGLVDKLISCLDTDEVVEIYANLKTIVNIIHVDDVCELIVKSITQKNINNHETFLVGCQNISIYDIIDRVSKKGILNLKLNQKIHRSYIDIDIETVQKHFNWKPKYYLK